jgi:hypothetical protein
MGGRMRLAQSLHPPLAMLTLALFVACTAPNGPPPQIDTGPSFRPAAVSPTQAVNDLRAAWTSGDRAAADKVAGEDVVSELFAVAPKGWSRPKCKEGQCRFKKKGVPGAMIWTVQGGSTGYLVNGVTIPPIPLPVAHLPRPVWGLYLAAGGSGYSQLAAATAQLENLGMTTATIAQLLASCQPPAADRLQIPPSFYTVAVFFRQKSEGEAFRDELDFPALGLIKVEVDC